MDFKLNIQDKFNKELPADTNETNVRRPVLEACFSYVQPRKPSSPSLVHVSPEMLSEIGLTLGEAQTKDFLAVFSGAKNIPGTHPYAMCYAGHQFGNWAGQLGDGRAINLGEVEHNGKNWALQLKGAGETPYSRSADGLAVLRSSIREYLCSEAMHHLGIPTTRALSLVETGDEVMRDILYDGHPKWERGAVVCRTAESFIRFGNFEIFTARGDVKTLKLLTDFTIKHHFKQLGKPSKETYIKFFQEITNRSLEMVVHWQRVGFVHGVMNTDNMSILGLTIDYGPYGWLEGYDHGWTPNTTDSQFKRYRYGAQPEIVQWNLLQLANALYPLILDAKPLEKIVNGYRDDYEREYLKMMGQKLGLKNILKSDHELIEKLETLLQTSETDMTIFFRNLSGFNKNQCGAWFKVVAEAFYVKNQITGEIADKWTQWFEQYAERLQSELLSDSQRKKLMNSVNPKYVLRNYMAQMAIDKANEGDYALINELFNLIRKPYDEQPENQKWFAKRPEWARHKVGCSMLSCSS